MNKFKDFELILGEPWQRTYMGLKYHMQEAYIEKNLNPDEATYCPKYALFSHKYYNEINKLDNNKIYDYCFIGSINSCPEYRKWVIDFVKNYFTSNSIFINTDTNTKWELLGDFDLSNKKLGYCPKESKDNQSKKVQYRVVNENLYYFKTMCQSKFILCPIGDGPWSFRFYESLMCKSIPIVKSYHDTYRTEEEAHIEYNYVILDDFINGNKIDNYDELVNKNTTLFKKHHMLN